MGGLPELFLKASCYASAFLVNSRIWGYSVRAAPLQRGFGGDFCPGKSKSLSRCHLGCIARSSQNRNDLLTILVEQHRNIGIQKQRRIPGSSAQRNHWENALRLAWTWEFLGGVELADREEKREREREIDIENKHDICLCMCIYICCEVIIWSKFGGFWKLLSGPSWVFGSYYLVQVCVFSL